MMRGTSTKTGRTICQITVGRFFNWFFVRGPHVCPWWCCVPFDNPLRRLVQNPDAIIGRYVRKGDTVLDVGPGMGYFTIPMAKKVGEKGKVIAADVQQKMLSFLRRRAERKGLEQRIVLQHCSKENLGIHTQVDFILAFWMVHEVPDRLHLLTELFSALNNGRHFFLSEPSIHVGRNAFEQTVAFALKAGFILKDRPRVFMSRCALFEKQGG